MSISCVSFVTSLAPRTCNAQGISVDSMAYISIFSVFLCCWSFKNINTPEIVVRLKTDHRKPAIRMLQATKSARAISKTKERFTIACFIINVTRLHQTWRVNARHLVKTRADDILLHFSVTTYRQVIMPFRPVFFIAKPLYNYMT